MRGHCPKCGKFCKAIQGWFKGLAGEESLYKVTGICKKHGKVDLTHEEWDYDDFMEE